MKTETIVVCVSCGCCQVPGAWHTILDENGKRKPCCSRECAARLYSTEHVARYFAPYAEPPAATALRDLLAFVVSGRRYATRNPYSIPEVNRAFEALGLNGFGDPKGA